MENLLSRYYAGDLSAGEVAEVEAWMAASEENMKVAEQVYYICFASDALDSGKNIDAASAFMKVRRRIISGKFRAFLRKMERAAAIMLIPVAGFAAWLLFDMAHEFGSTIEVRSNPGMVSCITLPDSSRVWLNSDSYLRYPSRFGKERRVKLYGEGYFEVSKDPKHKFVVEAQSSEVVVHGTEFNVESYGNDWVRTTLVSGVVDMNYDDEFHHSKALRLKPSQQAIYNVKTGEMSIRGENVRCNTSWKDGKIVLENTSFEEALRMIGNKYNVNFIIRNDSHRHYRFTGTFSNQSLEVILRYFTISSGIHFNQIDERQTGKDSSAGRSMIEVI